MVKYEDTYMELLARFHDNPQIICFHDTFQRHFLWRYNKYSSSSQTKENPSFNSSLANSVLNSFFLLVNATSNNFGVIIGCSKNIDGLLGVKKAAAIGISINHFIPHPINSFHDQFMQKSLQVNSMFIMDKLRNLFILDDRGFLVAVTIIIKRNYDYKNSSFNFFALIEKPEKKSEMIFCRQDGLISATTNRISHLFTGNSLEVIGKMPLSKIVPSLGAFFDRVNSDVTPPSGIQPIIDEFNANHLSKKINMFLQPIPIAQPANFDSKKGLSQNSISNTNVVSDQNPLAIVFSALQLRTQSAPKRYGVKVEIQPIETPFEVFFVFRLSSIKPCYLTSAHLKCKMVVLMFRITLLKLFFRACAKKMSMQLVFNRKARRKSKKDSTFKSMIKSIQSSNPLMTSTIVNTQQDLFEKRPLQQNVLKAGVYVPGEYQMVKYAAIFTIAMSLSVTIFVFVLVLDVLDESYPYFSISFSEPRFLASSFAYLTAKQMKIMNPSPEASILVKSWESLGLGRILANFNIFQEDPGVFEVLNLGHKNFSFSVQNELFEQSIPTNIYDSMINFGYSLNRPAVNQSLLTRVMGMLYNIQLAQQSVEVINPLRAILNKGTSSLMLINICLAGFLCLFLVAVTFILRRILGYLNMIYNFGTKLSFSEKTFKRITKLRLKIGASTSHQISHEKDTLETHTRISSEITNIKIPKIRYAILSLMLWVMFLGFPLFAYIWHLTITTYSNRLVDTRNLLTENSYKFSVCLQKILQPESKFVFDPEAILKKFIDQNTLMFNTDHSFPEMTPYKPMFQSNLCKLSGLKMYNFCPSLENGLFLNDYLTTSNYMIKNLPHWLKQKDISNMSDVFLIMSMMRALNPEFQTIINNINTHHFEDSVKSLKVVFICALLANAFFVGVSVFAVLFVLRRRMVAALRIVRLLKSKVVYSNSKIKAFVETANQSI
jgi:hypothetical protein